MSAALAMMITEAIASAARTSTRVKPSHPTRARPFCIFMALACRGVSFRR